MSGRSQQVPVSNLSPFHRGFGVRGQAARKSSPPDHGLSPIAPQDRSVENTSTSPSSKPGTSDFIFAQGPSEGKARGTVVSILGTLLFQGTSPFGFCLPVCETPKAGQCTPKSWVILQGEKFHILLLLGLTPLFSVGDTNLHSTPSALLQGPALHPAQMVTPTLAWTCL